MSHEIGLKGICGTTLSERYHHLSSSYANSWTINLLAKPATKEREEKGAGLKILQPNEEAIMTISQRHVF